MRREIEIEPTKAAGNSKRESGRLRGFVRWLFPCKHAFTVISRSESEPAVWHGTEPDGVTLCSEDRVYTKVVGQCSKCEIFRVEETWAFPDFQPNAEATDQRNR